MTGSVILILERNENLIHMYAQHMLTYIRLSLDMDTLYVQVILILLVSVQAQYCNLIQRRKFGCGILLVESCGKSEASKCCRSGYCEVTCLIRFFVASYRNFKHRVN